VLGSNPVAPPFFVDCEGGSDDYDGRAARHIAGLLGPKRTIQAGIDAAGDGDTVLVGAGTYSGPGNVDINTWGKSVVMHAPAGPASTIVDCNGLGRGFLFFSRETQSTMVSGFTIMRALSDRGGAMACSLAHPRIRNCVLTDSEATIAGGGLYVALSTPILENCRIEGNRPEGVCMWFGCMHVEGNNLLAGNGWIGDAAMLTGSGALEVQSDVTLNLRNNRIQCDIRGPGTLKVDLASNLTIEGDAVINLRGTDANGTIQCDGMLRVRHQARISNTNIAISRASFEGEADISNSVIAAEVGAPYGQFFVEDTVTVSDNEIHADGDRYMDLDPSVFAGMIANNRIYVTITEGRGSTRGGLLELRGRDTFRRIPVAVGPRL